MWVLLISQPTENPEMTGHFSKEAALRYFRVTLYDWNREDDEVDAAMAELESTGALREPELWVYLEKLSVVSE